MIGRREFGDYQTPPDLAAKICNFLKIERNVKPVTVLEPTCGIGNFLRASLVFAAEKYFGIEINPDYCNACETNLDDARVKIICANFFNCDLGAFSKGNLLVIGNPPWVNNETLSKLNAANLPPKSNFKNLRGLDALTGASNFDICEYILLKLLKTFRDTDTTLAMLCKTSTARKVYTELRRTEFNFNCCELFEFDAAKIFGISASACLLFIRLTSAETVPPPCKIFSLDEPDIPKNILSYNAGFLVGTSTEDFDGKSCFEWRQGIKHDCARILELTSDGNIFRNGLGEIVDIEDDLIFPLVKGSRIKTGLLDEFSKYLLVTQRRVNEDTAHLKRDCPKTWDYLNTHAELFAGRKSSIYRGRPKFSMFGVGEYSFAKYKVVISGFNKVPLFALVFASKPVMTDDTTYFIGFKTYDAAYVAMLMLNSERVQKFLSCRVFLDAKRPYTKKVLERIDFGKIFAALRFEDLRQTERRLTQGSYLTKSMLDDFAAMLTVQPTLF